MTPALSNWFTSNGKSPTPDLSGLNAYKKVVLSGDSTSTEMFNPGLYTELRSWNYPGGELEGVTVVDGGNNGAGLGAFLGPGIVSKDLAWLIAQAPDLVVFSWGINDIRINGVTPAQLLAELTIAVNDILMALPKTDIVLRTPNSFLSTDPGGYGYIVPPTPAVTNATNNGAGLIRLTLASALGEFGTVGGMNSMATGNVLTVSGVGGTTEANGVWPVTVIDPNTVDLQGSSFVNAYASGGSVVGTLADTAQNYGRILKNAYAALANTWANVALVDMQDKVFGSASLPTAWWMANQLHPNAQGYNSVAMELLRVIGGKPAFSQKRAELARQQNPANPWAVYPREVEDPQYYDLVFKGYVPSLTSGSAQIAIHTQTQFGGINDPFVGDYYARDKALLWPGDLVQIGTNPPWALPGNFNKAIQFPDILQINSLGASLPPLTISSSAPVKIWRPKFYHFNDPARTIQTFLGQPKTYPYVARFQVGAAGTAAAALAQLPSEPSIYQRLPRPGDIIVAPGFAPITLTASMALIWVGGYIQINTGVNWTGLPANSIGYLFSTTPDRRAIETAGQPLALFLQGPLVVGQPTYFPASRPGLLTRINGTLITPGTGVPTVISLTDVYTGANFATVTFPAGVINSPTITWLGAWAAASAYPMRVPTVICATPTSIGAGAANALISLDEQ